MIAATLLFLVCASIFKAAQKTFIFMDGKWRHRWEMYGGISTFVMCVLLTIVGVIGVISGINADSYEELMAENPIQRMQQIDDRLLQIAQEEKKMTPALYIELRDLFVDRVEAQEKVEKLQKAHQTREETLAALGYPFYEQKHDTLENKSSN